MVDYGISGACSFADGDDETVVANMRLPNRMERAVAPRFAIGWTSAALGTAEWQLEYLWTSVGESLLAAHTTVQTATAIGVANTMVMSLFAVAAPSATDVCLEIRFKRLAAGLVDNIAGATLLLGMCLEFTSNKLGTAV